MDVRYPDIEVQLSGEDGNAYGVLGHMQRALRAAGLDPDTIGEFRTEAMSGDYDHLLQTCMRWVEVS